MKTIDTKSLILGALCAILLVTLTSSKTSDNDEQFEFVGSPTGLGIYNKSAKTLYWYRISAAANLKSKPSQTFKVLPNGSELVEIE